MSAHNAGVLGGIGVKKGELAGLGARKICPMSAGKTGMGITYKQDLLGIIDAGELFLFTRRLLIERGTWQ